MRVRIELDNIGQYYSEQVNGKTVNGIRMLPMADIWLMPDGRKILKSTPPDLHNLIDDSMEALMKVLSAVACKEDGVGFEELIVKVRDATTAGIETES